MFMLKRIKDMGNITFSKILKLNRFIETLEDDDLSELLVEFSQYKTKKIVSSVRLSAEDMDIQGYLNNINELGQTFLDDISDVENFIVDYIQNELGDQERAAKVQSDFFKQKASIQQKIFEFSTDIAQIVLETNAQEVSDSVAKQQVEQQQADAIREQVTQTNASPVMEWGSK